MKAEEIIIFVINIIIIIIIIIIGYIVRLWEGMNFLM